jgi:hypothetical protein
MSRPPHNNHRTPGHDPDADSPEAGSLSDPATLAEMTGTGLLDIVDGVPPVPINIRRITDHGRPHDPCGRGRLTPQLAVLPLGVFTRPGDVVVDLAADAALAGAARTAGLTFLPWPLPAPPRTGATGTDPVAATAVLTACRQPLTADGCAIVALAPATAQPPYIRALPTRDPAPWPRWVRHGWTDGAPCEPPAPINV